MLTRERFYAKHDTVRPQSLQTVTLALAREREIAVVLRRIVEVLAAQGDVALARVWLVGKGDVCASCRMRPECPDRSRCLHLVASAGTPSRDGEDWSGLDGEFRRFPLGVRKVGKVGASGTSILLHDMSERSAWIAHPEWARSEGIRSFAAHPLMAGGEVHGVLAVFSRARVEPAAFAWLRAFADHAAVAIVNARAFAEVQGARERLEAENTCLRADAIGALGGGDVVGRSAALRRVFEQVALVAPTDATVLVLGESGTGKELVARRVHERSRRAGQPFITVNCAAVARERFESELFGQVKGAFTGATADRVGRFQAADGGTLFLDEVGDIPLDLQGKLLRALQEGEVGRLGDARPRRVDVRVIAATNRDLAGEVAAGRFREDLYFRLGVFPIVVPPLRARPDDVAPLLEHFLRRAGARQGRAPLRARPAELRALERYPWPGNVRELASLAERAAILGRLEPPAEGGARSADGGSGEVVPAHEWRRRERTNLESALRAAGGRVYGAGGAAELLGVPPTTLASRLKALGIVSPGGRARG